MTLMGQHTVPLLEDHAATRERWSLNSLTDSAEEQISDDNMPGFEIMFKAERGTSGSQVAGVRLEEEDSGDASNYPW